MPSPLHRLADQLLPGRTRAREEQAAQAEAAQAAEVARKHAERIEARRRAMLDSDSAVRTVTFEDRTYYGRVVSQFTAAGASARNLTLVADALEQAGVEYFLVPGRSRTRHVVALRRVDRKKLLDTLRATHGSSPLYALRPSSEPLPAEAVLYADGSLPTALKRQDVIRFGEILLGPAGQILADLTYGCDVEFWNYGQTLLDDSERGAARMDTLRTQAPPAVLADALVAPRPNAVSDVIPADACTAAVQTVEGRDHPTHESFVRPRIDTVDFPIDLVYTWVDGDDPDLAARRNSFRAEAAVPRIHSRESGASRYTSRDELKYSLRSVEMYAPFVRNIYLVTDGQTPAWLDTEAVGLQVIDHKDIFTDPTVLPVFNSQAIETQLHHIPGLSEHYLYLNDDVFFTRPSSAGQFFHGNGIAKLPFSPFQLGISAPHPDDPAPNSAGKNVRELMLNAHGRFTVSKFKHTPHPQLRRVLAELDEQFADHVQRTSRSRFRATTDIAMATSLHHHHAYLTGRAVPGTFKLRYIDVGKADLAAALDEFRPGHTYDFLCLNDVDTAAPELERVAGTLRDFLESQFPFASRWEAFSVQGSGLVPS
ncbi:MULTISPECIES: stealth family protein [unclassified Streptomyces]|uniref:stealth family protein n=1 Tax=unclassified Streptomyces TaxID=2593676 RepID=UPI0003624322|nr:stealth family protein [Streptomyces sp. HmicA12]